MDAEVVMAAAGAAAGVSGALLAWVARGDNKQKDRAVEAVQAQKNDLERTQQALDATAARATRAEAGETRERERAERAEVEKEQLEDRLDEQRERFRQERSIQELVCRETQTALAEQIVTLRNVLVSEVAQAAADAALKAPPHPHDS